MMVMMTMPVMIDDGDDEDVWHWRGNSDVDTSLCEDG